MGILRCSGCGHNFYNDSPMSDGRCGYCHEDDKDKCCICGKRATCSEYGKSLCSNNHCRTISMYKILDKIERDDEAERHYDTL